MTREIQDEDFGGVDNDTQLIKVSRKTALEVLENFGIQSELLNKDAVGKLAFFLNVYLEDSYDNLVILLKRFLSGGETIDNGTLKIALCKIKNIATDILVDSDLHDKEAYKLISDLINVIETHIDKK